MFLIEISIRSVAAAMTYDIPFLHHVTSNKAYNFCMFSKFVNFVPIDLKVGANIDWTYTVYLAKNMN